MIKTNKKGNFLDIPYFIRGIMTFAVILFVIVLFYTNFNTGIQNTNSTSLPNETKVISERVEQSYFKFDILSPFMYLGFLIFSFLAARLIPSSSKFVILGVFMLIFLPFISMFIENFWYAFANHPQSIDLITELTFTNFIMSNLRYFTLFYSLAVGVALYTKDE